MNNVSEVPSDEYVMDHSRSRYPCCIVWTPIPLLTWLCPVIGHMGIAMSSGVIRDFAGPYYVSEDNMGFGKPTKYWQLDSQLVKGGTAAWDRAVTEASDEYKTRMHNLCFDNCHSHVAMALNLMGYKESSSWNMIKLFWFLIIHGKYVSLTALLKTWLPFIILYSTVIIFVLLFRSF